MLLQLLLIGATWTWEYTQTLVTIASGYDYNILGYMSKSKPHYFSRHDKYPISHAYKLELLNISNKDNELDHGLANDK